MIKNDQAKPPWYQSNFGAGLAAGAVLLVLGWIFVPLIEPLSVPLRALVIGSVGVVGLIVFSLVSKTWRARTWVALGKWLGGLRVTTRKGRDSIRQAGFDARSAEIAEQRARVVQPRWRVDARDALGESNLYWLNNSGGPASEVRITTDPDFFVLDGEVYFAGFGSTSAGGSIGQWFKGHPTEAGKAEGATFHIEWRDANSDLHERDVVMPAPEIMAGAKEAIEESWAKGRSFGRQEAFEEAKEAAAGGGGFKPHIRAQWLLTKTTGEDFKWQIHNMAKGSVAKHVSIDVSAAYFRAGSALDWESIDGGKAGDFLGQVTQHGYDGGGVPMKLSWTDVHDRRQSVDLFWEP